MAQEGTFLTVANIIVPADFLPPSDCSALVDLLGSVGDKWPILLVGVLSKGSLHYKEIQRRVNGISQRMLTLTLKRLEEDELVTRIFFPSVPPRVSYALTDLGHALRGALVPRHQWAAHNREAIARNRANALEP